MAKPLNSPQKTSRRSSLAATVACGVVAFLVVGLGGCRAVDNAQVDVIERELRQQEDYIYELENAVNEYSEKLRECRSCEAPMTLNALPTQAKSTPRGPTLADDSALESPPPTRRQGRKVTGPADVPVQTPAPTIDAFELPPTLPAPSPSRAQTPATGSTAPVASPATTPQAAPPITAPTTPVVPQELEAPSLEIGPTSKLHWKGAAPIATTPPGDEAPPFIPDPADYQINADASPRMADNASVDRNADRHVEAAVPVSPSEAPELIAAAPALAPPADPARLTAQRLQIRRVLGPSPAADGAAGGSLLVVVEALNATDEPVDANGEVSLMVMAGENPESLQRIDRWDFTAEEAQAAWQSSQLGDGLHLELPLGKGPLPEGQLELWARSVNADGKKLLTKVPFAASELESLEQALAKGAEPQDMAAEASTDALTEAPTAAPAPQPQSLGANGDPVVNGESLNSAAPVAAAAAQQSPRTQWRASNEPLSPERVQGFASTAGGASGGWTRQAPGRVQPSAAPRVATGTGDGGRPRWQQGSPETPQHGEPSGAWAPFR